MTWFIHARTASRSFCIYLSRSTIDCRLGRRQVREGEIQV